MRGIHRKLARGKFFQIILFFHAHDPYNGREFFGKFREKTRTGVSSMAIYIQQAASSFLIGDESCASFRCSIGEVTHRELRKNKLKT